MATGTHNLTLIVLAAGTAALAAIGANRGRAPWIVASLAVATAGAAIIVALLLFQALGR
jgi:hypothetical protein